MEGFGLGMLCVCIYFVICASVVLVIRMFSKIPDEVFRKILHFILLGSLFMWLYAFKDWKTSVVGCIVFAVVVYPILKIAEHIKGYSKIVTERKSGELKSSLLIVFAMFAIVIGICWGMLEDKLLAIAAILAWGVGDASAALIGKRFGKKKIYKSKTLEGTLAMFVTSCIAVLIVLLIKAVLPWYICLVISLIVALVASLIELFTPNGLDTFTCPLGAMVVMLPLINVFGGLI